MAELTAELLVQRAIDFDLLDDRATRIIWADVAGREIDIEEMKAILLRHNLLTTYQLERLLRDDKGGYYYGKYKILYQVGQGTFARVYRAAHRDTGQIVAIKVLRKRFLDKPENIEQFHKEGEVGMLLKHPNIVGIIEVGNHHGNHYMVLEFIEGRNLREFLRVRGSLDQVEATRLMVDITRGLDHAHKKGLSHRDLKTSNVLLTSQGIAKLVDFGLAGVDPDLSDESIAELENPRTIDYSALEKFTNSRKDDTRSDIYFLGCIYYNMLAGKPPLQETRDRLLRMSRARFIDAKPVREVNPKIFRVVATVVEKAMNLDVNLRYQTPHDLLGDLLVLHQKLHDNPNVDIDALLNVSNTPENVSQIFQSHKQRSLMIVEAHSTSQDTFRDLFKKNGFRVLMTSDPQRPANTFNDTDKPADCVVFSTTTLGQTALHSFNEFGANPKTQNIPAILLLSAKHGVLAPHAQVNDNRAVVTSPIRMKEFTAQVEKLINTVNQPVS